MSAHRQYCLTLSLEDNDELIREYVEYHKPGNVWPEVIESIRASGIIDMQIYRSGLQLIMVLSVSDEFGFEAKSRSDSVNPKVVEWEQLMERFQERAVNAADKWQEIPRIFELYKHHSSDRE